MRNATMNDYRWLLSQPSNYGNHGGWLKIADYLRENLSGIVVDFGTGRGAFPHWCAENCPDVRLAVGMDNAWPQMPAKAHEKVFFVEGDMRDACAWASVADWIVTFDVLEHIDEDGLIDFIQNLGTTLSGRANQLHYICHAPDVQMVNGEPVNVHVTQRPPEWWGELFESLLAGAERIPLENETWSAWVLA